MRMWGRAGSGSLVPAALLAVVLAQAGCGKTATGPNCDASGVALLAFSSDRASAGQYDIYLFDLQAGGYHLLSGVNSAAADSNPTVTPDARLLAWSSRINGSADLAIFDRASCSFIDLSTINTAADEVQPAFSYDGNRLLFARDTLGFRQVRMLNGAVQPPLYVPLAGLDQPDANDASPVADLHAAKVAFVSDRNGNPDIFLWSNGALVATPGLNSPGADVDPALSADGRWLAFASDRDTTGGHASFGVYVYDLAGDSLVALPGINSSANERHPSLSRSNASSANLPPSLVGFQSDRTAGDGWDVFVYTLAGHQVLPVQPKAGNDVQPWLVWP